MTGDQPDMLSRLRRWLPSGWFGDSNPVLNALLNGFAYALSLGYSLLAYAQQQTRLATASGGFLDLASYDFFGSNLPRKSNEADAAFSARIRAGILCPKGTRPGMVQVLTALTGRAPIIFEPARPADTLAINVNLAVNTNGGVGSLALPYQCFITAFRPLSNGGQNYPGLNTPACALNTGAVVASLADYQGQVTDDDILAAINDAKPEGTTCWVRLSS